MSMSFYVWTSYALSGVILLGFLLFGLARLSQEKKAARALEEMAERRRSAARE